MIVMILIDGLIFISFPFIILQKSKKISKKSVGDDGC